MQVFGIFKWKKHLNKDTFEIKKTKLRNNERIIYLILAIFFTLICYVVLVNNGDKSPIFDSITSIFSVSNFVVPPSIFCSQPIEPYST